MTIECVTIDTCHLFKGNPIADQHKLRYASIIGRQNWPMPNIRSMEYDQYDNPATVYLIWRDDTLVTRGVCRLCSTKYGSMLADHLGELVNNVNNIPHGDDVLEGSRFCIDKKLSPETRTRISQEIVIAYLEYGLAHGIKKIIGAMYPVYWRNLFEKNGWEPVWIGEPTKTDDGKKSLAAVLPLNKQILANVRKITGIHEQVISYGVISQEDFVMEAA